MSPTRKKLLNRNIRLFGIYKIFTKRVFLPLTTIYATEQAGLNIQQIGLIAGFASFFSVLLDVVTGYWADKYGRRRSSQVGALIAVASSAVFIVSTGFVGILSASILLAAAYSFLNGSMEALIHDTLVELKNTDNYAKIASRAQAVALAANAVLITLVPLLYPIDKRLPFAAGLVAYGMLFGIATMLTEPKVHTDEEELSTMIKSVRKIINRYTISFFLFLGVLYAIGTGSADTFNLGLLELGYEVKYLGLLFGVTSLFGALFGIFVHHLQKLSLKQYAVIDIIINLLPFISYGVIRSLPLTIVIFIFNFSFWRYEQIMYQHYILKAFGTTRLKATIVSITTNFRSLHEIWIAIGISSLANEVGILKAIGLSSWVMVALLPILLVSIHIFEKYISKRSLPLKS